MEVSTSGTADGKDLSPFLGAATMAVEELESTTATDIVFEVFFVRSIIIPCKINISLIVGNYPYILSFITRYRSRGKKETSVIEWGLEI